MEIPGAKGTLAERLPIAFADVPYVGGRFPGALRPDGIADGANCQLYAYAVLDAFGLSVPALRSSELWTDPRLVTVDQREERELDLVLYNDRDEAYGAHVGVIVGTNAILHLCAEVGRPAVWEDADFSQRERYRHRLGARRVADPQAL